MGLSPVLWGRYYWNVIMLTAARYDQEALSVTELATLRTFFEALPVLLPCPGCTAHLAKYLKEHPYPWHIAATETVQTASKTETLAPYETPLVAYVIALHNYVNRWLGKPELTPAEAWSRFQQTFFQPPQAMMLQTQDALRKQQEKRMSWLQTLYDKYQDRKSTRLNSSH